MICIPQTILGLDFFVVVCGGVDVVGSDVLLPNIWLDCIMWCNIIICLVSSYPYF